MSGRRAREPCAPDLVDHRHLECPSSVLLRFVGARPALVRRVSQATPVPGGRVPRLPAPPARVPCAVMPPSTRAPSPMATGGTCGAPRRSPSRTTATVALSKTARAYADHTGGDDQQPHRRGTHGSRSTEAARPARAAGPDRAGAGAVERQQRQPTVSSAAKKRPDAGRDLVPGRRAPSDSGRSSRPRPHGGQQGAAGSRQRAAPPRPRSISAAAAPASQAPLAPPPVSTSASGASAAPGRPAARPRGRRQREASASSAISAAAWPRRRRRAP